MCVSFAIPAAGFSDVH